MKTLELNQIENVQDIMYMSAFGGIWGAAALVSAAVGGCLIANA